MVVGDFKLALPEGDGFVDEARRAIDWFEFSDFLNEL